MCTMHYCEWWEKCTLSSRGVPLNHPPIQDTQCNILERVLDFPNRDAWVRGWPELAQLLM